MIKLKTTSFHYDLEENTFSAESSDIGRDIMPVQFWNSMCWEPADNTIELTNPKTSKSMNFYFTKVETMSGGEEVGAWVYETLPLLSNITITLIIFND